MTYFHFFNCAALCYLPSFFVYKCSRLSEGTGAVSICGYASLVYVGVQVAKMLALATFLASTESHVFSLAQEVLKAMIGLGDLLGMYICFQQRTGGEASVKALAVGLAWATSDSVLKRLAPLYLGARSLEFSWKFILTSLEANVSLALHIALAFLVSALTRKGAEHRLKESGLANMISGSLFFHAVAAPILSSYIRCTFFPEDVWAPLALYTIFSAVPIAVSVLVWAAPAKGSLKAL